MTTKYTWINTYNQREESIQADAFLVEENTVVFFDSEEKRIGFLPTGTFRNLQRVAEDSDYKRIGLFSSGTVSIMDGKPMNLAERVWYELSTKSNRDLRVIVEEKA